MWIFTQTYYDLKTDCLKPTATKALGNKNLLKIRLKP